MKKLPSVLLADDNATTNYLNELLLESLGIADRLRTAEHGPQALESLTQQASPAELALLLLGVNMPGMSGLQFLELYRPLPQAQRAAPVIVLPTTTMKAQDLARLTELPLAELVSRPLPKEKLATVLQLHFRR